MSPRSTLLVLVFNEAQGVRLDCDSIATVGQNLTEIGSQAIQLSPMVLHERARREAARTKGQSTYSVLSFKPSWNDMSTYAFVLYSCIKSTKHTSHY
ncbi:hypothetical protein GQ53DRAFT_227948 [Thozetella sp. PMI_491]|nr:hypothetical protein GQ53DRAFT_227948 [Thozetella sp. PMI_491]